MSHDLYPQFVQSGTYGSIPTHWVGKSAVDGDAGPWLIAPRGSTYGYQLTDNQQELYQKVKHDARDDDWVLIQGTICQRILRADFTDGGSTAGTKAVNGTLPIGAYYEKAQVYDVTGFTGDTSAVITISGGVDVTTDVDGYMTGTPSVFTTTVGLTVGVPSGVRTVTTAGIPVVTVTSAADFTNVAAGALTVTLFYKK
jgi:hypothetical protein